MKTLKLVIFGIALFLAGVTQAQVSVHLNIGVQPLWAPVGYADTRYYYLPDVESYYDVNTAMFIYLDGNSWIHRRYLPGRYRNYDLYRGYKVGMRDYHGNTPYYHHREYRTRYAKGYHGPSQRTIGVRPGREYDHDRYDRDRSHGSRVSYEKFKGSDRHGDYKNQFDRSRNGGGDDRNNDRGKGKENNKGDRGHGKGKK